MLIFGDYLTNYNRYLTYTYMKLKLILLALLVSLFGCKKTTEVHIDSNQNLPSDSVILNNDDLDKDSKNLSKAPDFSLKSIDGKEYSLADFKGKYVYMDIWATWCGPCKIQIPYMKELEDKFHDAPIHFVSISVDEEKDKPLWKQVIEENKMSGIQLFAGRENNFGYDYQIKFIPTFILLDKEGNILLENAPVPMDNTTNKINQQLVDILTTLK